MRSALLPESSITKALRRLKLFKELHQVTSLRLLKHLCSSGIQKRLIPELRGIEHIGAQKSGGSMPVVCRN